jgi:hypothetical protein
MLCDRSMTAGQALSFETIGHTDRRPSASAFSRQLDRGLWHEYKRRTACGGWHAPAKSSTHNICRARGASFARVGRNGFPLGARLSCGAGVPIRTGISGPAEHANVPPRRDVSLTRISIGPLDIPCDTARATRQFQSIESLGWNAATDSQSAICRTATSSTSPPSLRCDTSGN